MYSIKKMHDPSMAHVYGCRTKFGWLMVPAIQWTGENIHEVAQFVVASHRDAIETYDTVDGKLLTLPSHNHRGPELLVHQGDYIVFHQYQCVVRYEAVPEKDFTDNHSMVFVDMAKMEMIPISKINQLACEADYEWEHQVCIDHATQKNVLSEEDYRYHLRLVIYFDAVRKILAGSGYRNPTELMAPVGFSALDADIETHGAENKQYLHWMELLRNCCILAKEGQTDGH